ncbi:MAG: type IV secretory system conjugative DNA transfer family protein [bacterium]|nr:type IV secretory system conjugative DNA transfer family protein [bacterium]
MSVAIVVLSCWATTQWAAWRLGFAEALGPPWIGLVYPPWGYFVWAIRFRDVAETAHIWEVGHWAIAIPSHLAILGAIGFSVWRARQIGGRSDLYGSARFATKAEIEEAGLLGHDSGVYVGALGEGARTFYLRDDGPSHCLAFAPTRSGKGVGLVLPTLLGGWVESAIIHDMKGENYAQTAAWRREMLGHRVLRFDPTAPEGNEGPDWARYNPLEEVRLGPLEVRDAQNVAAIIMDTGDGSDDTGVHWTETGADFLTSLTLHVLYSQPQATLRACLDLVSLPGVPIETICNEMIDTAHDPSGAWKWRSPSKGEPTRTHPTVSAGAQALLNKSPNERSSVVSTVRRALRLFADPVVARSTEASDFRITDLVAAETPTSLYLTIAPADLRRTRVLMRVLLQQVLHRLTEKLEAVREGEGGRRRLLLMLDEFTALGRLHFLHDALGYIAGYGIKAYIVVQDLEQLRALYGRDEAISANCDVRVAFRPNKLETARVLSEMTGQTTVHKETRTYTGSRLSPWLGHVIAAEQETQRALLTSDEIMRLGDDAALIFAPGLRPILGAKIRYYEDPTFSQRAGETSAGDGTVLGPPSS